MSTIIIRRNEVLCDSLQIKTVCEVLVNKQVDVDVVSLRDSITLTTECRPTGRLVGTSIIGATRPPNILVGGTQR